MGTKEKKKSSVLQRLPAISPEGAVSCVHLLSSGSHRMMGREVFIGHYAVEFYSYMSLSLYTHTSMHRAVCVCVYKYKYDYILLFVFHLSLAFICPFLWRMFIYFDFETSPIPFSPNCVPSYTSSLFVFM